MVYDVERLASFQRTLAYTYRRGEGHGDLAAVYVDALSSNGLVACVGRVRPTIMRIVVDLPEPFGPTKPVTRPGWTEKLRLSTAGWSP